MQALLNWIVIMQHELCNGVSIGACRRADASEYYHQAT